MSHVTAQSDAATRSNQLDAFDDSKVLHQKAVEKVIAKVDAAAAELGAEAEPSEALGKLTDKAVELSFATGVFDVYLPKELGGMGLYPGEALPIMERVAYIDGSIGWVNTIFAAGGLMVSFLPDQVSDALLSGDEKVCFGAVSNGMGMAEQTDEGWKISGSYRYASGIKHAQFVFMPAIKVIDGAAVPPPAGLGFFLVPTSEVKLGDGWDVIGLRATGSVDVSVENVVLPKENELNTLGLPSKGGRATSGGMMVLLPIMHLGFAMGASQRILDELKNNSNRKPPVPNATSLAESDVFRVEYARKYMEAKASNAAVKEVMEDIDDTLRAGNKLSTRQISLLKAVTIHSHEVLRDIANWAFQRGGGTALREGALQRTIRDALAGCQHFIASDTHYKSVGFDLLGAPDGYGWINPVEFGPLPDQH
ncbi:MAG: hypothetical protein KDA46_13015 [Parvularculaceae bacterium]|nr:hypothetical protein [Parvularculaceae bacterium]